MRMADSIVAELKREASATRRVLERVPDDKLSWKPHPKSMSLGQLALHVATIPGRAAAMVSKSEFETSQAGDPPSATRASELTPALENSLSEAGWILGHFDDDAMMEPWKLIRGGKEIFSAPRARIIRSIMLNHWYHHRGQLSVYLRLLDVPVPSIYGPSADEDPFG
jgi:uncharacterized damage-inducible protein DinB